MEPKKEILTLYNSQDNKCTEQRGFHNQKEGKMKSQTIAGPLESQQVSLWRPWQPEVIELMVLKVLKARIPLPTTTPSKTVIGEGDGNRFKELHPVSQPYRRY